MMDKRWEKYVDYIRNTGHVPLPTEMFDEDWEPIGPMVRSEMIAVGLITIQTDGIRLAPRNIPKE